MARKRPKKWQPETSRMIDGIEWITAAEFSRRLDVTQTSVSNWCSYCPLLDKPLDSRRLPPSQSVWLPSLYVASITTAAKLVHTVIERHGERWINIHTFAELAGVSVDFVRRHIDPPQKKKRTSGTSTRWQRSSRQTLDVLNGRTIRLIEAKVILGLKRGSSTTRYYLAEEDAITIRKRLGTGRDWITLQQAGHILKLHPDTIRRKCKSRHEWHPDGTVIEYDVQRRKKSNGAWDHLFVVSRHHIMQVSRGRDAIKRAPPTPDEQTVDGIARLTTAGMASGLGVAAVTIHSWHSRGCCCLNGEKLKPVTDPNPPRRGWHGKLPKLFWRFDDLKRIKAARAAAIQAGWSGRGPLLPDCLKRMGDDPSKANGKITPPPPAEANSTKSPDPTDEAMAAAYIRKPSLKRNLLWLVKDAEFEADGVDDRCAAIRDWWNALDMDERAETGLRGKIAKRSNGSSVVRRGLAAARAFLKEIGVLATDRKGVGTARIFYSIVWSELALLAPSYKPATKPGVATKPPAATKPSGEQNQSITAADLTRISPDQTRISHDQTRTSPAATETVFETKINLLPQTPNHFKPERSAPWTEAEEEILKVGIQMTKAETIAAWKTRACFSSSAK